MEQSRIDRISELTRLSRVRELTADEQAERKALREEYIASIRQSLTSQLENTYLVDDQGHKRPLPKKP